MKKFYFTSAVILPILTFFLLPIDITKQLSGAIHTNIQKPLQKKFCVLQKSTPSFILNFTDPAPNTNCFINEKILKKKIINGLPAWAKKQIQEDLSRFSSIRVAELDQYFRENNKMYNALARIKIQDGKVYITKISPRREKHFKNGAHGNRAIINATYEVLKFDHRAEAIYYVLQYLAERKYIPDCELILGLNDYVIATSKTSVPIFTFAKDLAVPVEKNLILIPDWQNLSSVNYFRTKIISSNKIHPWEGKESILFWRGGGLDSTGFRKKLVSMSKEYPDLVDADFSSKNTLVQPEDHLKYKYLISIDGARCSWERLIWHLHTNSLTFKHQSTQVQWFYKGILPYIHYVPVQNEKSLLTAIDWANTHPTEVQAIIANASIFVEENLALEDMYHYYSVLLQEYTKKLKRD